MQETVSTSISISISISVALSIARGAYKRRRGGTKTETARKRERGEEKRLETVEFVYYSNTTTTGSMFAQFLSPATS